MPFSTPIAPAASSARTTSGTGSSIDLGVATTAVLTLTVAAVAGTLPTLDVAVQTSADGTTWTPLGAFTQAVAVTVHEVRFPEASRYIRAAWTIGGTSSPSFTFGVAGQALVVYAKPSQMDSLGIKPAALANYTASDKDKALCSGTDMIDSGLVSGAFKLPLTAWGGDVVQNCIDLGTYLLMRHRGFNPESNATDGIIVKGYDDARAWIKMVATEAITPSGVVDSTPDEYDGGAFISRPRRGWCQ